MRVKSLQQSEDYIKMYCASDNKTIPEVSSSQSSRNVKDGKFVDVNLFLRITPRK